MPNEQEFSWRCADCGDIHNAVQSVAKCPSCEPGTNINKVPRYFFSFQFSAIQKAVLRHDRLWSIAGMSQILSRLNELELPAIANEHGGNVLVAGGGKFTAWFSSNDEGMAARTAIIQAVSSTLPMLEFQYSNIVKALSWAEAKTKCILDVLSEMKNELRGYGVSFNPHFELCKECGEYPATNILHRKTQKTKICRICYAAYKARPALRVVGQQTTLDKIYNKYLESTDYCREIHPYIPDDLAKLFPAKVDNNEKNTININGETDTQGRMAVWLSDINNMKDKVFIWLDQPNVREIFEQVKNVNIQIVSSALKDVFDYNTWNLHEDHHYLPFRLIVAGGDDLCLVFPEEYALQFAQSLSNRTIEKERTLTKHHCLNQEWLKTHTPEGEQEPGRYCFGSSFIITPIHTPFKAIHSLGENLMSLAKNETNREANSINWCILSSSEDSISEKMMKFDKPLFINSNNGIDSEEKYNGKLSLEKYIKLTRVHKPHLTESQVRIIASIIMQSQGNPRVAERQLLKNASAEMEKGVHYVLADPDLRTGTGSKGKSMLDLTRVANLLELITIKNRD